MVKGLFKEAFSVLCPTTPSNFYNVQAGFVPSKPVILYYFLLTKKLVEVLVFNPFYFYTFKDVKATTHFIFPNHSLVKMKGRSKIRVGFIDTTRIYKAGLQVLLKKCTHIEIVGEAKSDKSLLRFIIKKRPDILLVDVHDKGISSVGAITTVIRSYPAIRLIILSSITKEYFIADILDMRIGGFVLKDSEENIIDIINKVYEGKRYLSTKINSQIEKWIQERRPIFLKANNELLTKTEEAVVKCICSEMTSKEIAQKLFLSVRTIEGYRLRILQKIQAKGTAGIVIHAIQKGLLDVR